MRGLMGMALMVWLLASAWSMEAFAAAPETPEAIEQRRISRLVSHLRRLEKPKDWLLVRKLFSSDSNVQLNALSNCPLPENEWPWYLSSDHLKNYAFSVDFIPLNMDADKRLETLMVIQSDHAKDHYITFCLMDDDKSARKPLASYSDMSRGREITYQVADLTADGSYELIVNTREGSDGRYSDAVRVIKPTSKNRFDLMWFARLQDELKWPKTYVTTREAGPSSGVKICGPRFVFALTDRETPSPSFSRGRGNTRSRFPASRVEKIKTRY